MGKKKIVVVMPAYNAANTLEKTLHDIPKGSVDDIVLVDDASTDNTVEIARKLGLDTIVHSQNRGYGANQKSCYDEALKRNADIVVMIHPDYQYDSRLTPHMTAFIDKGVCDIVLGSRIRTRKETLEGGMPVYKYISNRFLTIIENIALGQNVGDFHTGFRAYSRKVLETIPYIKNSDDFVFDTQFLVQAVYFGFKIGDVPVPVRYYDDSSSINFKRSTKYGLETLGMLFSFYAQKLGLRRYEFFKSKSN
ncbi:MAG: glycosyltransferase family 2 protein [Nitrospiraceae bacterium]|nr:MAG: glycosyltransferase family 2 protein [Nitrospiraceae bacterium]